MFPAVAFKMSFLCQLYDKGKGALYLGIQVQSRFNKDIFYYDAVCSVPACDRRLLVLIRV